MLTKDQARQNLERLIQQYHSLKQQELLRELTESDVIQKFIEPLLQDVLGRDIRSPAYYRRELRTDVGRPDLTLRLDDRDFLYIEAKGFGVIKELPERDTNTLENVVTPGEITVSGVRRSKEDDQAIRYAFQSKKLVRRAILTDFDHLPLYDVRRDMLVVAFEGVQG